MENISMLISSGINQFLLTNLSDKFIGNLTNNSARLSQYFQRCIATGSNICSVEGLESFTQGISHLSSSRAPASIQEGRDNFSSVHTSRAPANVTATQTIHAPANVTPIDTSPASPNVNSVYSSSSVQAVNIITTSSNKTRLSVDENDSIHTAKKSEKLSEKEQCLFDELLVTQVMTQPMLYNPRLKIHKIAGTNADKWKIIGERISEDCPNAETSIHKLKEQWKNLRDDYLTRQLIKEKPTGSGRPDVDEEPLDEFLSSLNDVYDLKENASNIVNPEKVANECHGSTSKDRQNKNANFENGALQIIESNNEKLSAISNTKNSLLNTTTQVNVVQDKASKFCDLLQLELRELDEKAFFEAQIQIFQIISNLRK